MHGKQNAWLVPEFQCNSCGWPNHWQHVICGACYLVTLPPEWLSFFWWAWSRFSGSDFKRVSVHPSDKSASSILSLSFSVGYDVMTYQGICRMIQHLSCCCWPRHTPQCLLASSWSKPFRKDFRHLLESRTTLSSKPSRSQAWNAASFV